VRNALDHGIESPEVRKQLGKSVTAVLTIKAYHEGGQVVIEIADDGAGIALEKVKARAIRERLLSPQQAEEISERDLMNLIFRPGFSTAETVTIFPVEASGWMSLKKISIKSAASLMFKRSKRMERRSKFAFRLP
jgi:two-component system chemotaxis sensor kinase CheA